MRRQPSIDSKASQANTTNHGSSATSALAAALSFGALSFTSHSIKPAKLTLTPHHLFYLLSRFEDLSVSVGPMNIRLENINTEASSAYVSFLNKPQRSKTDRDSIHSVSSVRSVMSSMSSFWTSFGLGSRDSESKSEKAKAALGTDLKYLYSAFTKIPCLRLAPDHKARLIRGYEEFPFDTAVPLHAFKNLGALEIIDIDFRSFFGWDRLAEQLRTLTLKRAHIEDPADLLTKIVLDDIDKRRRRSSKCQPSPVLGWSSSSSPAALSKSVPSRSISAPGSPVVGTGFVSGLSPQGGTPMVRGGSEGGGPAKGHARTSSISPSRAATSKHVGYRHTRGSYSKLKRSGSGSSNNSDTSSAYNSSSNHAKSGSLPASKWRFLRHLSLADNALTNVSTSSLVPVAGTLHSFDLSWNLFTEIPDSLASLVALRSLNLSNCMIDSLHSLSKNPLPAITALNLRGNRLRSIAGIERLLSLERLDLRDNNIRDPTEIARLTAIPYIREIWVSGNPFTKSYSGYRVTLFNLFRKTAGFSEDIIIDSSGPSYSEKKQLVERVVEPEAVPVVRAPDLTTEVVQRPHAEASPVGEERPKKSVPEVSVRQDHVIGSGRRKKAHRRRIIDVTKDEFAFTEEHVEDDTKKPVVQGPIADPFVESMPKDGQKAKGGSGTGIGPQTAKDNHKSDSAVIQKLFPAIEGHDWDVGGDIYRQRLEALKQEVGANWLTVLGDDTWDSNHKAVGVPEFDPAGTIRSTTLPRSNSQVIVTGARSLG